MKKIFHSFLFFITITSISSLEININRSFTTKEKPRAIIYTSPSSKLYFRLYKINNVIDFLQGQKNPHSPALKSKRLSSGGYLMWKSFMENFKWSLFQSARRYMTPFHREKFLKVLKLRKYNFPYSDRYPQRNLYSALKYPLMKEWSKTKKTKYYYSAMKTDLPKLKAGFYLLEVSQGRHIAFAPLLVTDIALLIKEGRNSRLVYTTKYQDSPSLENVKLWILHNPHAKGRKKILFKKVMQNGIFFAKDIHSAKKQRLLYVVRWQNHYAISDINYYGRSFSDKYRTSIYSDRPVYRQGHKVHFKGVIFKSKAGSMSPLSGKYMVEVMAPNGKKIFQKELPLSEFGTFESSFTLSDNAKLGYHRIQIKLGENKYTGGFYVEQYKKPSFRVKVTSPKKIFVVGKKLTYQIRANYYSGGAIAGAKVKYEVERKKISYPWWWGYDYSWYYSNSYSYGSWSLVLHGKGKTDNKGKLSVSINPLKAGKPNDFTKKDYIYRIKTSVTSNTRETIDQYHSVKYVRGAYSMRLSQKRWYYTTGQNVDLKVHIKDWHNNRPTNNISVNAILYQEKYERKKKKYQRYKLMQETKISNEEGNINFEFANIKTAGRHLVVISYKDQSGKTIATEKSFWLYTPWGGEQQTSSRTIEILPDKTKYKALDKVSLRFKAPIKDRSLLVTFEKDNIFKYKIIPIKNHVANYRYELTDEHTPDVYIKAHAFSFDKTGISFSGSRHLIVPPINKFLKLTITSDREKFRPGERGRFLIKAVDANGKPVKTEYSLAVVDESIFAFEEPKVYRYFPNLTPP